MPCGEAECTNENSRAVCRFPDTDIHCGFEAADHGCAGSLTYFGKLGGDDADWTLNSGPTLTADTGPDAAAMGEGYLYVESNFPPDRNGRSIRTATLRLSPRRSAKRCLTFRYHMFGQE